MLGGSSEGGVLWDGDGSAVALLMPSQDGVFLPPLEVDWPTGSPLREGVSVDDGPAETMVALRVPSDVASRYGREAVLEFDLVPLQDRHITLAYLGELDGGERQRLHSVVRRWLAESEWPSLEGEISGWGTFAVPHGGGGPVLWMGWSVPGLGELRDDLRERLIGEGFTCVDPVEYVPHETVGYATGGSIRDLPVFPDEVLGCVFDGVVVAEDDVWTEYPFMVGGYGDGGLLCASGRPAVVAALMAAAAEHERVLAGVLDGGFTVAVDSGLTGLGAVVADGSSVDGFEVFAVGGDGDGGGVELVEGDRLWLPSAVTAGGGPSSGVDVAVVGGRSSGMLFGLPLEVLRGAAGSSVFLQNQAGKRMPLRASTSVLSVVRFLRDDGAVGSIRRTDDGALLASAVLWTANHTPTLLVSAVPSPDLSALRGVFDAERGDWAAMVAAARKGGKGNRGNAARLKRYWLTGKGAAKIRWNTKGDFSRCRRLLSKHMGPRAAGYCAGLHKLATGEHTGDMSHRIKFGWGGKPGSYWAARAAKKGMKASAAVDMLAITDHGEGAVMGDMTGMVDMVPDDGDPLVMFMGEPKQQRFRIPLLLPEGVESGDGRMFEDGAVEVRETPIPLLWQPNSMQGHDGAMIVGRIDHVERTDGGIGNCTGVFDTSPVALEAVRMIREGFLRGVSADLDKFEAKVLGKGGGTAEAGKKKASKGKASDDDVVAPDRMSINQGRVMAATLVAKPAFEQASIELEDDPVDEVAVAASVRPEDGVLRGRLEDRLWWELRSWAARQERSALVASGGLKGVPVAPPASWFEDPKLDRPTHLTITDDGRVFGHIAAWHVDHIGLGFGTRPPKSKSGYAYFRTGALRTAEGGDVRVGQLTLSGGHAPLQADARDAVKHYDDTASAFADVAVGEDRHGIWVAGALRPDVSDAQLRAARASSPSGDWRPINGRLELVAVCQVNVPGFPVVEARVASGAVVALVAAGTAPLLEDRVADRSDELQAAALSARARVLRARVGGTAVARTAEVSAAPVAEAAAGGGGLVVDGRRLTIREAAELLFALREQRSGESVDVEAMAEALTAAGSGEALPDGSFLIRGERDLRRAVESFGSVDTADRRRVRNHIRRRAAVLGLVDMLPSWWVTPTMKVGGGEAAVSSVSVGDAAVFSKQPVSSERREKMAEEHTALPDGSYPIADAEDLRRAIKAYGRSRPSDRKKVRDHIMKRARALGHPELIPDSWKGSAASVRVASGAPLTAAEVAAARLRGLRVS